MPIQNSNSISTLKEAKQRALAAILLVASVVVLPGCGSEAEARLEDYLMELEFETPLDSTREIELGTYVMSIAARNQVVPQAGSGPEWMQVRFRLFAVVDPENESTVKSEIARHRGLLDDTIMLVCRSASVDELADYNWSILKSRIIDKIRPILGHERLRQLVVIDAISDPI